MTSPWPWLKEGEYSSRLKNPIDLLDEYDERPAVKDVITDHRAELEELKAGLKDDSLYDSTKHDDLWLVRFLLSQKKVPKALSVIKNTLLFRKEHHLDEKDLRGLNTNNYQEIDERMHPYVQHLKSLLSCCDENAIKCQTPHGNQGQMVFYVLTAKRNQNKMMDRMNEEEYRKATLIFSEWSFQWIDYLTRSSGRISKMLRLMDAKGTAISMLNRQAKKLDGQTAKLMEDKYPQMLGMIGVINAPTWINVVLALIKLIVPKRVLEKIAFLNPSKNKKDLKPILKYVPAEKLPTCYGGTAEESPLPDLVFSI